MTLLHRGARALKGFDPDLVAMLIERTKKLGIDVHLQAEVSAIERHRDRHTVQVSTPKGKRSFDVDLVVHGAGRVPDIEDLRLENANIDHDLRRGVKVNEFLQSVSNPAVYAAGDCAATAGLPLTPVGSYEGRVVVANLLDGNKTRVAYPPIPSVVFTVPPLASVGLLEAQARERGLAFETHFEQTDSWYSTERIGEQYSAYKVLVEKGSERIRGAHLLGPNAEEAINLFTMAMTASMSARDIKKIIFAYPTYASDIGYMV